MPKVSKQTLYYATKCVLNTRLGKERMGGKKGGMRVERVGGGGGGGGVEGERKESVVFFLNVFCLLSPLLGFHNISC